MTYRRNRRIKLINGKRVVPLPKGVFELRRVEAYLHRVYYPLKRYEEPAGVFLGNVDTDEGRALTIIESAERFCWEADYGKRTR